MHTLAFALLFAAAPARQPTLTVDMQDAEIGSVLRLLADVSGKNIVFGDNVKGKVTLKLKDVSWRQAMQVVLKTHGLGMEQDGNVILVAPQAQFDAEEQRELDAYQAQLLAGPLVTRILPVNNADANELAVHVKALLTARGSVSVDTRTNTLIVTDVKNSHALGF